MPVTDDLDVLGLLRKYENTDTLMKLAADEIERLRAEVDLWMGAAERLAESHPQFEAFRYYFRARTKAVRSD